MNPSCPWCHQKLDPAFIRNLGRLPEPCPLCARPIRTSAWQILFTALALLPLLVPVLWLSRIAYDHGSEIPATVIVIVGVILGVYLQRFLPRIRGPVRGRKRA